MSAAIDKARIIAAIKEMDDERILFAIERLLQIDTEDVPEWHKRTLEQRIKEIEEGNAVFHNWDQIKDALFQKSK